MAGKTVSPATAGRGGQGLRVEASVAGPRFPEEEDPHHAEPAWPGRGKRSGLNRASAFRHALGTRL